MATDSEPSSSSSDVAAVIVAATRLYDSIFYNPGGIDGLSDHVKVAYGDLGATLRRLGTGSERMPT